MIFDLVLGVLALMAAGILWWLIKTSIKIAIFVVLMGIIVALFNTGYTMAAVIVFVLMILFGIVRLCRRL